MSKGRGLRLVVVLAGFIVFFLSRRVLANSQEELVQISDLGYPASTLSHMQPGAEYWFELPGNWLLEKGGYFELVYSVPPEKAEKNRRSVGWLSIEINGEEAGRVSLTEQTVSFDRLRVPIAATRPTPQGLHVVVQFHPRPGTDHCAPPDERTVVVRELSAYRVKHSLRPADEMLSALPYPFSWQRARAPIATTFVLSESPREVERNAAARVAEWIGSHAGSSPLMIRWRTVGQLAESGVPEGNVIVVALKNLGSIAAPEQIRCSQQREKNLTEASLHICRSVRAEHHAVLWISAGTERGLKRAVSVLVQGEIGARGRRLRVDPKSPEKSANRVVPWSESKRTFRSMGQGDLMFRGRGTHKQSLYLRRPRGWQLGSSAKLVLHTSTAEHTEASLRVRINGQQMGFFTAEQLREEYQMIRLPAGSRSNRTSEGRPSDYLVIELEIEHRTVLREQSDCDPLEAEPWTLIHQDSVVDMRPEFPELPNLFWFPYPFDRPGENLPTQIVLQSGASTMQQDAALQVSAELARVALADPPRIELVHQANADRRGFKHTVLLGRELATQWAKEARPSLAISLERPRPPEDKAVQPVVGQIVAASHPANARSQILILEADEPHLPLVARALHAAKLDGTRVLITEAQEGIVVGDSKASLWRRALDAFRYVLDNARLDALHWLLLLANVFLVKAWRNAVKVPVTRKKKKNSNTAFSRDD